MTIYIINKASELTRQNSTYCLQGISGNAVANTTTNIDWQVPTERWITGGIFSVEKPHWGDSADLQIVDVDNVLGLGADVVLNTFVSGFRVRSDEQLQCNVEVPYVSLLPAGVYVRIRYTNTHISEDTNVALNLFSHVPTA